MSNISNLAEAREARRLQKPRTNGGKGFALIHRQFMDSKLYKDSQAVHLFLHLILKANHSPAVVNTDIGEMLVERGQLITGRPKLVSETFIPDNKVKSLLRSFEGNGMIRIESKGRKFSLITVLKYDDFQAPNCPTDVQRLSNANTSNDAAHSECCPTDVQRLSINNNINNISNTNVLESTAADEKSDKKKSSLSCQDVVDAYHEILPEAPRIRALNDKRKNQIRTFWRKAGVITRQLDGHGFTMQDWRNYLSYVGENCRWMFEERPNHQRGTVWHKKGFDFLLNDNTYLKVREGEHDDR
ncbi:DNA replication protein [Salmonella enterica subsp. arizonae serovar 41:z4,z23:-]|uniref:DNA replication protein n=1 Tax=Salmonella enterica subsp. arizonae TaxID=59203 RepID=A0A632TXS3_SALER|nr:DNA replication protein [Salmonella enterica]EDH0569895.1 DNA replication protein [Salmonella enterica subsp. arizonae]EGZ8155079.1 DNA replication protein [Salmonella enterica subsp. enterica serovar Newport]OSE58226.1 DNA replication protein [Salmonella enterica subsp. arizonae serovar 41:z4,z23:-]HAC6493883.1 DNA replication protein [Salmonella enterica subsp. houtenae serovar 44:z36[z38]:-]